jgi:outer membrane protein TolC
MTRILISLVLIVNLLTADSGMLFADEPRLMSKTGGPQTVISLGQAMDLIKKKHPDIHLQEIAVRKAAEEVTLATRAFLPDVDVDYIVSSASGGWGLILTAAKLLQPVFSFRKLMTEEEVKKILKEKEEALIRYRELEVEQGVKELYVTLLIQRELSRILTENAKRSQERYELVKIHHKEGGLNDEELFKEKFAYETARSEAGKAEAWLRQSEFAFERLLDLPHGESFFLEPVSADEVGEFPLSLEECLGVAYSKNPIVKSLLLEEKASLKQLGIKDPMFQADGAFLGFGEAGGGILSGSPRFGFIGNLTLYDWGKERLKKRILGLEHSELVLKHEKEFQAFESAIVKAYFELERLQSEIKKSGVKTELVGESKRRGEILGEAGRIRQTDLLSLENEYTLERSQDRQKRLEYFLVRERLVKDLGLFSLDEIRGVTAK